MESKYRISYLPLFYDDLDEIVAYIADELKNPAAANRLLDRVESAILERNNHAELFEPYYSARNRKYAYYRIYVGNFVVYYVIISDDDKKIMEVRRILYMGRNRDHML